MYIGIYKIKRIENLQLDSFKKFGNPSQIVEYFDGKAGYLQAIREWEEGLYKAS